jgi:hypothetical protein
LFRSFLTPDGYQQKHDDGGVDQQRDCAAKTDPPNPAMAWV